ncbi:MAG: late competence development ComFB family protein [Nodosilinea sp.]
MKIVHEVPKRSYVNVMERIVAEEVAKQMQGMPPRVLKYLTVAEVETYALNRLPGLYASSEKGWQHQYEKARRELHNQVKSAVRQAFAAVQVDPIRASEPLHFNDDESARGALESLREMLKQPDLSWDGIVNRLRLMLGYRTDEGSGAAAPPEGSHRTKHRSSSPEVARAEEHSQGSHYWRPGTYGSEVSWQKTHRGQTPQFDWNDPRYSK